MSQGWGRRTFGGQPDGRYRQSQIVTTFGPGSMIDLLDHAVLVGGLEYWSYDKKKGIPDVQEPRLRDAVAALLRGVDREVALEQAFREPPVGDDSEPTKFCGVRVLEFPQWFVCQNPDCRALLKSRDLELKSQRYVHGCSRTKQTECVPVRFVTACPSGHLDEFPWVWFTHRDAERCAAPSLRLVEGATGDFSEVVLSCACGARAKMSTAQVSESLPKCAGRRLWLGHEANEECGVEQRLLVRTASNSYFAQVVSALSVPELGREVENAVRRHWDLLQDADDEGLPHFLRSKKMKADFAGTDENAVRAIIAALRSGKPVPREPIRTAEFKQFLAQKSETPGELPGPKDQFFARAADPDGGLPKGVGRLVLAHKLREVRVQVGFTRLEPVTANLQGEYDLKVRSAALGQIAKWLPASEIRGEGIFVQLDEAAVEEWENRPEVFARGKDLLAGYDAWSGTLSKGGQPAGGAEFPKVRFYLLHSLAHLLMSAMSLECGYAASALRERIYCSAADTPTPMAGILISTGTPGAEGTLGGLVEQGRQLIHHLRRAYDLGILCSNDPVCGTHSPADDPSERWLEGAACHGCLFVAECSCERFNRYLDRALVVPTIGHSSKVAFFSERP